MKKLLRNKKGFTLMEMLIVVAIIVILVAISVPTFSASLNEAKEAADDANFRAAKAAAVVYAIENTVSANMYYDIDEGEFVTMPGTPEGYGQSSDYKGEYIVLETDGDVAWSGDITPPAGGGE